MLIEYTAKRSIQTGHNSGEVYTLYTEEQKDQRQSKRIGPPPSISTSGNQVTITHRMDELFDIITDMHAPYDVADVLDWREFLDSVSGGETFSITRNAGENLIGKPTFEDGNLGNWVGGVSVVSANWPQASKVLQGTTSASSYNVHIPVVAGETIYAEAWGEESGISGGSLFFQVDRYDSGFAYIASNTIFEFTGSGLQHGQGSYVVASGTAYIKPKLYFTGTGYMLAAHPKVFRKGTLVNYVLDGGYTETRVGNRYRQYKFRVREL